MNCQVWMYVQNVQHNKGLGSIGCEIKSSSLQLKTNCPIMSGYEIRTC